MSNSPAPSSDTDGTPTRLGRRRFLQGTVAGAATVAATGAVVVGGTQADARSIEAPPDQQSYPFHGVHQSGILTPDPAAKQNHLMVASFDVIATTRTELISLLNTITERARFLTCGGTPTDLGVGAPPSDSALLGPLIPADGLTITLGVGASLFDQRFGLAEAKPAKLKPMRVFPNDQPDPSHMHGDLMLQLCANHPDTLHHALRDIARHTRGAMQPRWKMQGYNSPPRPSGTARNLLGFKDGTANPTGSDAESLLWVDDSEKPAWTRGGTYQVVRLIRMLVEFWDRISISEQENMFGRRRNSGAPLDGATEFDTPDYTKDPNGEVIPMNSHIRLANPHITKTQRQRLVRRSYNYDLGLDPNGNMACGHVFICFQQDVERQFESIQTRLIDEPLVDYVTPFGGGYFFITPGVRDDNDWFGSAMFR
jgi:deferrochelatase/peroxidase EfeB